MMIGTVIQIPQCKGFELNMYLVTSFRIFHKITGYRFTRSSRSMGFYEGISVVLKHWFSRRSMCCDGGVRHRPEVVIMTRIRWIMSPKSTLTRWRSIWKSPEKCWCWYTWDGILTNQPIHTFFRWVFIGYIIPPFFEGLPMNLCFASWVTSFCQTILFLKWCLDGFWLVFYVFYVSTCPHCCRLLAMIAWVFDDFFHHGLATVNSLGLEVAESCSPPNTGAYILGRYSIDTHLNIM